MILHSKRWKQALVLSLSFLVVVLSAFPSFAVDTKSLESKTSDLQNQLAGINQELLTISNKISSTEMQVEITNSEILRTQDALTAARADEAQRYEDMKTRIKYMYETDNATLLEMLFSADNMADFLNKADFIQNISDYDRDKIKELRDISQSIADQEDVLVEQQTSLSDLQKNLETQESELTARAAATSTDLNTYQAQLTQLREEEAAKLAAEAAAAKKAAEEAAAAENNKANSNSGTSTVPDSNAGDTGSSGAIPDDTIINGGGTNASASDLDVFAAILDCEAHHDYTCMLAVATVIMNRVNSPSFPNSIPDVIYANGQFEPVWSGRLDKVLSSGATNLAYQVAQDAINGSRLATVSDCFYFLYAGATDHPGVNVGDNVFFPSW